MHIQPFCEALVDCCNCTAEVFHDVVSFVINYDRRSRPHGSGCKIQRLLISLFTVSHRPSCKQPLEPAPLPAQPVHIRNPQHM